MSSTSNISIRTLWIKLFPLLCCLFSLIWIWALLDAAFGVNACNINDLLINQEFVTPENAGPSEFRINDRSAFEKKGIDEMKRSSATFIGVGMNIADRLPDILERVDALSQYFDSSRAVFAEGDSTDNTHDIFDKWTMKSTSNRTLLTISNKDFVNEVEGHFIGQKLPREGRIARVRNGLMDMLYEQEFPITNYIVMIDLDVLGWDMHGVADSFGRKESTKWDVICANGIMLHGIYRDTYAFRAQGMNTNHHMYGDDYAKYNITPEQRNINQNKYKLSVKRVQGLGLGIITNEKPDIVEAKNTVNEMIHHEFKPMQVDSCFGGLAIYDYEKTKPCKYAYRHPEPPHMLDCEHVLFHDCLMKQNGANIFFNPNMKLWYGHTSLSNIDWGKLRAKAWDRLGRLGQSK